jgi:hypothetical protein
VEHQWSSWTTTNSVSKHIFRSYEHQEQTSKFTRKQIRPQKCRVAIHIVHMSVPRNHYQLMHIIHTLYLHNKG